MQFVDKALARRFESGEEMPQVFYARVFQKTRPGIGAAEEEFCGGHMIFAGLESPIGRATGMGLDRPFTAQDLDRVEQFYRSHRAPSQVDLCPLHDAAVFEMFKERGYGIAELNNVLYRKLDPTEEFSPAPDGCEIRRGLREQAEATSAIVERAFFPDGAPEAFAGLLTPLYQMDGRQNSGLRRGSCHSGAPDLRSVRSWNAVRVSWARPADGAAASASSVCRGGRMRIRSDRDPRRHYLAAEL